MGKHVGHAPRATHTDCLSLVTQCLIRVCRAYTALDVRRSYATDLSDEWARGDANRPRPAIGRGTASRHASTHASRKRFYTAFYFLGNGRTGCALYAKNAIQTIWINAIV